MPEGSKKLRPIEAVRVIFDTLEALDPDERERVLSSALALFGAVAPRPSERPPGVPSEGTQLNEQAAAPNAPAAREPVLDIRTLKERKNPGSNREMAALVAYYLAELAPGEDRKDSITAKDIEKYFKQAHYRLPQNARMTLVHSKDAGYLEPAERGKYKLSPVGYNLVVHGLPRAGSENARGGGRRVPRAKPKARGKAAAARSKQKKRR